MAINGTLSAHEHRGFDEGILPSQSAELMISEDPDSEGDADQADGHGQVEQDAAEEDVVRGQRFAVVLVGQKRNGHERLVADMGEDGKRWEGAMGKRGEEVGRSWIRTSEGVSQQIYSLPRLATSVSARELERLAKKRGAVKSDPKKKHGLCGALLHFGWHEIHLGHTGCGVGASGGAGFGAGGEVGSG